PPLAPALNQTPQTTPPRSTAHAKRSRTAAEASRPVHRRTVPGPRHTAHGPDSPIMGGQLPDLPPVFRLAEARALGLSVHAVRGAVQRGALRRVGHGLYAVGRVSVQDGERWAIVRDDHL